jgi:PD-(D/E)XK endonuclease
VFVLSSNQKGGIAETAITAAAYALDIPVLRPVVEHARYDLAFEIGDRILRVQCKWGGLHDDGAVIKVNLVSSWCTPTGYERRYYSEDEIDLVAVYCHELNRCYLLPSSLVARPPYHPPPSHTGQVWAESVPQPCSKFRVRWGYSSAGRALAWQARGRRFESG